MCMVCVVAAATCCWWLMVMRIVPSRLQLIMMKTTSPAVLQHDGLCEGRVERVLLMQRRQ